MKEKLDTLPESPGVYYFYDETRTIIYVGKAKNLKNRVKSYFTGSHNLKTQKLVENIKDLTYTIVDTPKEALILENIQIKKHKPKYNILLKDDKQYPFVKITNEEYPRVIKVRKKEKDGAKYFGPYPSEGEAKFLVELINSEYPIVKLANCGKRNPCLYYHTKSCLAPCFFEVDKSEYNFNVKEIIHFLNGNQKNLIEKIERKMHTASEQMNFELAKELRDKIQKIKTIKEEQKVILKTNSNLDVINYSYEEGYLSGTVFQVRKGVLLDVYSEVIETYLDEEESFLSFIEQFYMNKEELPKEVLLPMELHSDVFEIKEIKTNIPIRGEKKKLLEMVEKNSKLNLRAYLAKKVSSQNKTVDASEMLAKVLEIKDASYIECFDNSNIQGSYAVSAMVMFKNGKPEKSGYRKFKVKTVEGANDVGTMQEVIKRRYTRLVEEKQELPSIIFVDGGIQQVVASYEILQSLGLEQIPVFGLAKNEKHKTSHVVDPFDTIYSFEERELKEAFNLITRIQDEVHRFAISFFRQTHGKETFKSVLDEIKGMGKKRKTLLLKHFGSVENIKKASIEEMKMIGIPEKVAEEIIKVLKNK